jgi:hypothetical protein
MKQLRLYRGSSEPPPPPPPPGGGSGKFPSEEEIQPVAKPEINKPDEDKKDDE